MKIMIAQENRKEAKEVIDFVKTLEKHEMREFLAFLQGAQFMKKIEDEKTA
ncbi:MAG: hypothetical protein HFE90_03255 [Firmicutes bacterium]|nr:hypothetical protein [Bacillota bacterium]